MADMVRKMNPEQALQVLEFTNKAAAEPLAKSIKTVLANAKQLGVEIQNTSFSRIEINEGVRMKRLRAGSRGRANPYKKRTSHIKIVLSDERREVKTQKLKATLRQAQGGKEV